MVMDPTGSYIYSVSADSRIHRHSAVTLSTLSSPTPLSDPRMRVGSFHVRASISPCGEYLASGSTGGQVFVWSLRDPTQVAVVLQATGDEFAERETASVDWAADGSVCSFLTSIDKELTVLCSSLLHAPMTGHCVFGDRTSPRPNGFGKVVIDKLTTGWWQLEGSSGNVNWKLLSS